MLKILPAIGLLTAGLGVAGAQVKVELMLEQKQYLMKEPLLVGVRVVNHSGQTLALRGGSWLSFVVEDRERFAVKLLAEPEPPQPMTVESTYMATQWVDLGQAFDFRESNRYTLRARVHVEQWREDIFSEPVSFEVIKGTKLWEQEFGLPTEPGTPPQMRKYALQQASYLENLQLYARVSDLSDSLVYKVVRLAPLLLISQPEAQIDGLSQLHVLTQTGMRHFMHFTLDPSGTLLLRNTYESSGIRPVLRVSPSGSVYVKGGQRLPRENDLPRATIVGTPMLQALPAGTPDAPGPGSPAAEPVKPKPES